MNKSLLLISFLFISFLVSSCAVDPRKEALAYQTRLEADQSAASAEQQRQIAADLHAVEMADKNAAAAERQAGQQRALRNFYTSLAVLAWVTSLAVAAGIAVTSIGVSQAAARSAMVKANCIRLDPATGQFPLLIQYAGHGRYSLHNPNTGSVTLLDSRQDEHRMLIQSSGAVQLAGVIARAAAHARDAQSVASITPVLIEMETNK